MSMTEMLPAQAADPQSRVATLSGLWGGARERAMASYAGMAGASPETRWALDARAGDLMAEMGDIEKVLERQPAADLGDVLSKALIAVVLARECAAPEELGTGWPLVVSLLRDLLAMATPHSALAALTAGLGDGAATSGAPA